MQIIYLDPNAHCCHRDPIAGSTCLRLTVHEVDINPPSVISNRTLLRNQTLLRFLVVLTSKLAVKAYVFRGAKQLCQAQGILKLLYSPPSCWSPMTHSDNYEKIGIDVLYHRLGTAHHEGAAILPTRMRHSRIARSMTRSRARVLHAQCTTLTLSPFLYGGREE